MDKMNKLIFVIITGIIIASVLIINTLIKKYEKEPLVNTGAQKTKEEIISEEKIEPKEEAQAQVLPETQAQPQQGQKNQAVSHQEILLN